MADRKGSILLTESLLQAIVILERSITSWTSDEASQQTFMGNATNPPLLNVKREAPPSTPL